MATYAHACSETMKWISARRYAWDNRSRRWLRKLWKTSRESTLSSS
jgi:hypothetical protein